MSRNTYRGQLNQWNDIEGKGTIKPDNRGKELPIGRVDLCNLSRKPRIGDIVFYQIHTDINRNHKAINVVIEGATLVRPKRKPKSSQLFNTLLLIFALAYVYDWIFDKDEIVKKQSVFSEQNIIDDRFSCQGKQHCSQMTSCAEANFYLINCPNTQIDGDKDGKPCESYLCNPQIDFSQLDLN